MINPKIAHYALEHGFFFISLISPNFLTDFSNFLIRDYTQKKNQIKQSYILFTWFYYLTILEKKKKNEIKFFVLPIKKKICTQIKAPIAHKNWSKEQFNFQFYALRISFRTSFKNYFLPNSLDAATLFVFLSKRFFPVFETNVLFLKNYKIIFSMRDTRYFNYFQITR